MEHYFTKDPLVSSNKREISFELMNKKFKFITDNGVFSKSQVDTGTELLIKNFLKYNDKENFSFLDFGCGYGVVGITISKFFKNINICFADINNRALDLSRENIELNNMENEYSLIQTDLFENINDNFDIILSNPPIRAGKKTIFEIYSKSYERLNDNGNLYVVIMTKHGAKSTEKELKNIFKEVICLSKEKGYRIYKAIK